MKNKIYHITISPRGYGKMKFLEAQNRELKAELEKKNQKINFLKAIVNQVYGLNKIRLEKTEPTDCPSCKHFEWCESPKQFFHASTGIPCEEFERGEKGGVE